MLDLIDDINKSSSPDKLILALFDIDNMLLNIDNGRGIKAVCSLDSSSSKNPSTERIMKGLEICLLNNKSSFGNIHLLQTNGIATGAPKLCSYSNIAISHLDIKEKRATHFQECFYFGIYHDDCLVSWCGDIEKVNNFHKMLNTLDGKLKFMMEIGGNMIYLLDFKKFYSK